MKQSTSTRKIFIRCHFANRKKSLFSLIPVALLLFLLASCQEDKWVVVEDQFEPLPAHSIKLEGYFENYIQNSISHWNKGEMEFWI